MKHYPVKHLLVAILALLIVFAVCITGYVAIKNAQFAVNDVSYRLRNEITARIEDHVASFLTIPHQINQFNAKALRQGFLKTGDVQALRRHFWNQIQIYGSVTSIYMGNALGGLVNAGREGPGGNLYVIMTDGFKSGSFCKYAADDQGNPTRLMATIPDFDARQRPWYTGAIAGGDETWSDIYVLFTGQDMAIAASCPVYDDQDHLLGVVAVDIFLPQISDFLRGLKIGKTGQAFIMERSGRLVASSTPEKLFTIPENGKIPRRLHTHESKTPIIRDSAEALLNHYDNYSQIGEKRHLDFKIEGKRHFLEVTPINAKYGLGWLIFVIIPEADFMSQIEETNRITIVFILAALSLALLAGMVAAQWISRPIAELNATAQAIALGRFPHWVPKESRILEISELTQSFNQMTTRLQKMVNRLTTEIEEHREAESALRSSEERLALVLKGANLGLWDWNIKTGEVLFNDRWAEMIGYTIDEIEPHVNSWKRLLHPEDVDRVIEQLTDHLEGRTPYYQTEHRLQAKSGEWRWVFDSGKVFTRDPHGTPLRALGVHQDITDRKQMEARLRQTLKEKEVLLQEIHHRVKNNLAIISSLMNLQARQSPDMQARTYLTETQSRVMAMAAIHEILYQTKDFSLITFGDYIHRIVTNLISLYSTEAEQISFQYDLEEIDLDIDQAVCCGLIVNELVTNALKYAFPNRRAGRIVLSSALEEDNEIVVRVMDDGVGLPPGLEWKTSKTLGLRLISLMVDQLKGRWEIISERGLESVIRWERKPRPAALPIRAVNG